MSDYFNSNKPKVIFYAPILSYPPKGGPQLSVVNAIKALHNNCELHIITNVNQNTLTDEALLFFQKYSSALLFCPRTISVGNAPFFERASRFFKRDIVPFLFPSLEANFIKSYASKEGIQIFWIDRVIEHAFVVFKKLRFFFPDAIVIGDTEAVYSRFILRELPFINNPIRWIKVFYKGKVKENEERQLVKLADVVTAVSDVDSLYYKSLTNNKFKIRKFSNTIDLSDFEKPDYCQDQVKFPNVLLLGTFGHKHSPMDIAADWLRNSVMPLVWKKIPDLHLYIVGLNANITQSIHKNNQIIVVGNPISVLPYLKNTIASLVPLRFESGTRFKIVESGAASVACISTTLGAEGLEITDGKNILIADDEENFSEAIIRVALDEKFARKLGNELHCLVKSKYSLNVQINEAKKILQYIKEINK